LSLTKTEKTPLLMFQLSELCAAVMPLCLRASSCTIHATITRCFATINIIIGKTPFRFASLKNHYTSSIKHQTSIASVF
jgi:hypothetical protein